MVITAETPSLKLLCTQRALLLYTTYTVPPVHLYEDSATFSNNRKERKGIQFQNTAMLSPAIHLRGRYLIRKKSHVVKKAFYQGGIFMRLA